MSRTIRQDGSLRIERTALGQVAEYDVYADGKYQGGGSKREATKVFNKLQRERRRDAQ